MRTDLDDHRKALARMLDKARRVVVFTGAGVSAESGIPTFRGSGGLWEKYPPSLFGNIPGLAVSFLFLPGRFRRFIGEALETFLAAEPGPAHLWLAKKEAEGRLQGVITQNIDGLHQKAGSRTVVELHGALKRFRCRGCGARFEVPDEILEALATRISKGRGLWGRTWKTLKEEAPRCPECGKLSRPDVVFFGEGLPRDEWARAQELAANCDLMLVLGTSGVVYPAAHLPLTAKSAGAVLVEINPEPGSFADICQLCIASTVGEFFGGMP